MIKLGFRYLWFKLALVLGSLLGLLLLFQSVTNYLEVSRSLVLGELSREARRQVDTLGREAGSQGIRDPKELGPIIAELRKDSPDKIAWIRINDAEGHTLVQEGTPVGPPYLLQGGGFAGQAANRGQVQTPARQPSQISSGPSGPTPAAGQPAPASGSPATRAPRGSATGGPSGFVPGMLNGEIRQTLEGRAWVTAIPLSLRQRQFPQGAGMFRGYEGPPGNFAGQPPGRGQVQTLPRQPSRIVGRTSGPTPQVPEGSSTRGGAGSPLVQRTPQVAARGTPATPQGVPSPIPGFRSSVEIALYMHSASGVFSALLRGSLLSFSGALGLVASMVLLWFRFPHYVNGKRLEKETELARQVQMDLLPPAQFTVPHMDFAAECIPAWQVGGDFYDVFSTDDGRVAMALGDVSGKGLPASVVVGLLLGALRASNWLDGGAAHEASSTRLSELIRARTALERFASLFWCSYEPETRALRYVNAGHLPPMLVRRSASGNPEVQRLEEGGPVLGVVPGATYTQGVVTVLDDDLLVIYSDGVVEATNSSGTQFEDEGLRGVILENLDKSSTDIRDAILAGVEKFLGDQRAQDDITLVVARFLGRPGGAA